MNDRSVSAIKREWTTKRRNIEAPPGYLGCFKCKQVKPESEFSFSNLATGKRMCYCKLCKMEAKRKDAERFEWSYALEDVARFLAKIAPDVHGTGCKEWTSSKGRNGYGLFYLNGRQLSAHRIAWFLAGKGIPPELPHVLDHLCKNTGCVNPFHLQITTQVDNCGRLALPTPHWTNKNKVTCTHGHPFSGWFEAHGKPVRGCLVCWPGLRRAMERFEAKYGKRPI